jgi:flagellar hook protein FlgE
MGSFSTPLSGLMAAQDQLQTVSNNLANMNTDGYKDQNLTFSDIFAETGATNGAGDPMQTGAGVAVSSTASNFTEGNLNATGTASNMAISGNGFFVTQSVSGMINFTRSGDFTTNNAGQLTSPNGDLLLGYPATDGIVDTSGSLTALQVGTGVAIPAVASTNIGVTANLDSDTAIGDSSISSTVTVYDSLGSAHTLAINYTKTAANTWDYSVSIPSNDVTGGTGVNTTVGSGTLNFSDAGVLTSTTNVVPITVPALSDGASPMTITGPFGTIAKPTITQTASANATSATTTNGFAGGTLSTYAVQPDGTIEGTFSSGKTLALGQVALASFANTQGLSDIGNNNYLPTAASGSPVIGLAGTGGRGTVVGGSVEESNVDIATEFAKLIVAQQAYSANAKSITTFNQVSQATLQMLS